MESKTTEERRSRATSTKRTTGRPPRPAEVVALVNGVTAGVDGIYLLTSSVTVTLCGALLAGLYVVFGR